MVTVNMDMFYFIYIIYSYIYRWIEWVTFIFFCWLKWQSIIIVTISIYDPNVDIEKIEIGVWHEPKQDRTIKHLESQTNWHKSNEDLPGGSSVNTRPVRKTRSRPTAMLLPVFWFNKKWGSSSLPLLTCHTVVMWCFLWVEMCVYVCISLKPWP